MRIAIIGGAGVRTPLLVAGLAASDLPIQQISLYDINQDLLSLIGAVARQRSRVPVACCSILDEAVAGADFVFLSIRAGGIEQRARDEDTALRLGAVGQETVGPVGFAMAMRTVPHAVDYARAVTRLAPDARIVNFTNPVGIVTQAMRAVGTTNVIGICDTPTELFERIASALGVQAVECRFDYFGLNHLGWVREVYAADVPQLHRVWNDPALIAHIYPSALFETSFLSQLRLLPSEYLFYYYRPELAIERARQAGETRGQIIAALNSALFRDLSVAGADLSTIYDCYLQAREAGYMQVESGHAQARRPSQSDSLSGYDRIALGVVRAIHFDLKTIIPLSVVNGDTIPDLHPDDVVEVPCEVGANGATPLPVGRVPAQVRDLLFQVKSYERMTVAAAFSGSRTDACTALAANPLVGDQARAEALIHALGPSW